MYLCNIDIGRYYVERFSRVNPTGIKRVLKKELMESFIINNEVRNKQDLICIN